MKSMTGHGRGTAVANGVRVVAECFSVNRRQAEVALAASRELAWIEPRVREEVLQTNLAREKFRFRFPWSVRPKRRPSLLIAAAPPVFLVKPGRCKRNSTSAGSSRSRPYSARRRPMRGPNFGTRTFASGESRAGGGS